MDVFDLDRSIIADYERFARSFTQIRSPDIKSKLDEIYAGGRFWPDPLITINPHFADGSTIDALAAQGTICRETAQVFRSNGQGLNLYRHQSEAVAKAKAAKSFVVTTGTGSGKSLCFFVPIIDHAIKCRLAGEPARTKAIIIYPMNALANSQMKELQKFIDQSDLPTALRPTFARYTGQESDDERKMIQAAKPDILLTNFMMLELLMTRQKPLDRAVIAAAEGLDYLVLDELHTYRGRQGADVAMLVRRVRDKLSKGREPICIGTSATMASEGDDEDRSRVVATVASRLFGTKIDYDCVIDESLKRATNPDLKIEKIREPLARILLNPIPERLDDRDLFNHPLAVWIELVVGLEDKRKLTRRPPTTLSAAAEELSKFTGVALAVCETQMRKILILMSKSETDRGGKGDRAFLAFKLHRFILGAGHVYSTLHAPGSRSITLDGQLWDPKDNSSLPARLYSTNFCRVCGQEYHPVTVKKVEGVEIVFSRSIDDPILEDADDEETVGYLAPCEKNEIEIEFSGNPEDYPDEWQETTASGVRLKSEKRKYAPSSVKVDTNGTLGTGRKFWLISGKFRFCLACKHTPSAQAREYTKLASLSAEGRSSATTLLVSSTLRWMNNPTSQVPKSKRKLLGFTDNRQDAALQAGHFNDFLFVSLLRAALLAAVRNAGINGLTEDEFGSKVQSVLGFHPDNLVRRKEWMLDPEMRGVGVINASRTLIRVLSHRVWADQRRGWRYTNPNLEQLGLIKAKYLSLDDLVADQSLFDASLNELKNSTLGTRKEVYQILFDAMRTGLAISTEALDDLVTETVGVSARQSIKEPWAIGHQERLKSASTLVLESPRRETIGVQGEALIVRASNRSALGKQLNKPSYWGRKLNNVEFRELLEGLLRAAEQYQIVRAVPSRFDLPGWQLAANAIALTPGAIEDQSSSQNPFFVSLYESLAGTLSSGGEGIFGIEGREHTAQVEQERREWREWRFRWEDEDRAKLAAEKDTLRNAGEAVDFLPVLFCSPTMELGVDISALNTVYLRNVPPTPANYAQRSGRAGRSGQAALIVTYCSAQGPHDQYYFNQPSSMVRGIVRPPALDLANRELVEAHLHAVWLAESATELASEIPALLDLRTPALPAQTELSEALRRTEVVNSSAAVMLRILESIASELTTETAPWAADRVDFVKSTANNAFERFSGSFERWRQLYLGARAQLEESNRRSEMHGLSATERREAKTQQAQANEQISLLERGTSSASSDFYSYRYLATEGFLPGYNFPRLPLYAFVPAGGYQGAKATYLQRARFLAISEFGPRSLIYHEGRAYKVHKARLPSGARNAEGKLETGKLFICDSCGAAHNIEVERCLACATPMNGTVPIRNVLRIDNVETQPAERISANDEERQRQGFEIQTVFSWAERDGKPDVEQAVVTDSDGQIARLDYAPSAQISRLNLGLKRRSEKSIMGFWIDPQSGRWMKGPDEEESPDPERTASQRVVPIVQDNKNALLFRLVGEMPNETTMATLQHALARGLDLVFQLEEGETSTEPTPSRNKRNAILAFEVSEGGAGVLSRLLSESKNLAKVARQALELMHLENIDQAIVFCDPSLLRDSEGVSCVKGCYRCLLSYYNQPDHELVDRTNVEVRRLLLRLARSDVTLNHSRTRPPNTFIQLVRDSGLPPPDSTPLVIDGLTLPFVWRGHLVAVVPAGLSPKARSGLENVGYSLVELKETPSMGLPAKLVELLRGRQQ